MDARTRRAAVATAIVAAGLTGACEPDAGHPDVVVSGESGETIERVTADPAMVRDVTAALNRYVDAVSTMDGPAIRSAFVPDDRFAWLEEGGVRFRSPDELLADLEARPSPTTVETELSGIEVVPVGDDAAHAWAEFMTSISEGEGTYTYQGVISFVLERRRREGWRVVGVHTSEVPPLLDEADVSEPDSSG